MKTTPKILVFQMAKVGSSSVYHRIKDLGLNPAHFHTMGGGKWGNKMSRKQFEVHPWRIITLVRDPVARNISRYWAAKHKRGANPSIEHLIEDKIKWVGTRKGTRIGFVLSWFNKQIKPFFGIDVYDTPFPKDIGYKHYSHRNTKMVLIRTEDLNKVGPTAISQLIGVNFEGMYSINTASDNVKGGDHSRKYEEFKKRLKLPENYLDRMYTSEMVQHFYTPEEIESFYKKWA